MTYDFLPKRAVPRAKLLMHQVVLLWNRMGPRDDTDAISRLDEIAKKINPRTGGITDDQTCGEVNDIDAVTDHFLRGVLNVTPRASVAGCVSNQGCLFVPVKAEGAFLLLERSETLAARAAAVAMADNDADLHLRFFVHDDFLLMTPNAKSV